MFCHYIIPVISHFRWNSRRRLEVSVVARTASGWGSHFEPGCQGIKTASAVFFPFKVASGWLVIGVLWPVFLTRPKKNIVIPCHTSFLFEFEGARGKTYQLVFQWIGGFFMDHRLHPQTVNIWLGGSNICGCSTKRKEWLVQISRIFGMCWNHHHHLAAQIVGSKWFKQWSTIPRITRNRCYKPFPNGWFILVLSTYSDYLFRLVNMSRVHRRSKQNQGSRSRRSRYDRSGHGDFNLMQKWYEIMIAGVVSILGGSSHES